MKLSELKIIINKFVDKSIREVLNEGPIEDKKAQDAKKISLKAQLDALNKKKSELSTNKPSTEDRPSQEAEIAAVGKKIQNVTQKMNKVSKSNLSSLELDEMARPNVKYDVNDKSILANLGLNKNQKDRVEKIISYIENNGPSSIKNIADHAFGTPLRQQQINSLISSSLVSLGILKVAAGSEDRYAKNQSSNFPSTSSDKLDSLISGEYIPGEEDESEPEESEFFNPDVKDIDVDTALSSFPTISPKANTPKADEDIEAYYKYSDLKDRLARIKNSINSSKRNMKSGETSPEDIKRLEDTMQNIIQRIKDLIESSPYLQSRLESGELNESKRMKHLANILK